MELQNFKQLATDLVELKAQIKTLQDQYDEKKNKIMESYEELGVKTYEIPDTGIKITKKTRTTVKFAEGIKEDSLMNDYPDYILIKKSIDKKTLQKDKPELFTENITEFVSVTGL